MPQNYTATEFTRHIPVLLEAIIPYLSEVEGPFLDMTLGGGGYAETLLKLSVSSARKYYGIDRDPQAIERSKRRLAEFDDRISIKRGNFAEIEAIYPGIIGEVSNLFLDLV